MRRSKLFFVVFFSLGVSLGSLGSLDVSKPLSGLNIEDFKSGQDTQVKWQDNPFIQTLDDSSAVLKLYAIVYNDKDKAALIGQQVLREGNKIGTSTIIEIKPDTVIIRNEGGIFQLTFEGKKK